MQQKRHNSHRIIHKGENDSNHVTFQNFPITSHLSTRMTRIRPNRTTRCSTNKSSALTITNIPVHTKTLFVVACLRFFETRTITACTQNYLSLKITRGKNSHRFICSLTNYYPPISGTTTPLHKYISLPPHLSTSAGTLKSKLACVEQTIRVKQKIYTK